MPPANMPRADPNGIAKRFAHEGARVHFPKCRHRPDPAAWSGDLCEEPVTFRGDRHDARLTMPQGDHQGPQRAANGLVFLSFNSNFRLPSDRRTLLKSRGDSLPSQHLLLKWKGVHETGSTPDSQVKGQRPRAPSSVVISRPTASVPWRWGRRAGGQAAAGRCPATAADTLGRRG